MSAEFQSIRDRLRHDLARPNVDVRVQEDFIVTGTETLAMLDEYIRQCDAVIHLVGDMTGAFAGEPSLNWMRQQYPELAKSLPPLAPFLETGASALAYTQWEAWLAVLHAKPLIIAVPEPGAPRDAQYQFIDKMRASQDAHLQRLATTERYPGIRFSNADRLAVEVLRSSLHDILTVAGWTRRVIHLPYISLGELFKGRDEVLLQLSVRLGGSAVSSGDVRVGVSAITGTPGGTTLHGLGGVGKTRLAVEFAWRNKADYSALLFAGAASPESLNRSLAALCGPAVLDLPEHRVNEEAEQTAAALHWLQCQPGWLLILDNVDSEDAAQAVEALLPQLAGGHVLITSRLTNWSAGVRALPLDLMPVKAATEFLLARTEARRRQRPDDAEQARALAGDLGHLALALEQAGAFIAQRQLTLAAYRQSWTNQQAKAALAPQISVRMSLSE